MAIGFASIQGCAKMNATNGDNWPQPREGSVARVSLSAEDRLNDLLAECYADPLRYVMSIFPWDFEAEIQQIKLPQAYRKRFNSEYGPDEWACQFLDQLGADIRARGFDGKSPVAPIQYTTVSGHGIGKSVMVAWLVKFIMDTRPFCRGTVTANTADQLKSKTWAEVGKWHRLSLTAHRFNYRSGRGSMSLTHKEVPVNWYCNAQTCREENSEAFAGQHAANSTSFYVFDEASAVPGKIWEVRQGGLTDGEPMTFDFGNGTRNSGDFYENCEGRTAHNYRRWSIDSRTVQATNKTQLDRWISDYGADSDFVRVRVKGEFPEKGSLQFIATGDVEAANAREVNMANRHAPLVLGVDPARFGEDESVIKPRMGDDARSWPARRYKGLDTVQLTGRVIEVVNEFRALGVKVAAIFVDGVGVGAGVVDQLRHLGYPVIEVQSAGSATDKKAYRRKGDEMWGAMRDHIKTRLVLPGRPTIGHDGGPPLDDGSEWSDLTTQLTAREYGFTASDQIFLESKRDMKERGVGSPDLADALALTYAQELAMTDGPEGYSNAPTFSVFEYDPLEYLK